MASSFQAKQVKSYTDIYNTFEANPETELVLRLGYRMNRIK